MAQVSPSGASLKTTLQKQIVGECGCEAFVVSAEVAPYYSYKLISTTNLSLPKEQWVDEFSPITSLTNKSSWAIPLTSLGNKFFRVVEMGLGTYVTVTLDPASPVGGIIQIMTNGTQNVSLITYDVKSHVGDGILGNAVITIVANSPTSDISSLFSAVKLRVGAIIYFGEVISTGTSHLFGGSYGWKVAFSDLPIWLLADTSIPITILVDVVANTDGILNGVKALAGDGGIELSVDDPNYSSIIPSETGPLQGTTFTFMSQGVFVSNPSASLGEGIISSNLVVAYPISFGFTVTADDQTLFVSSLPEIFVEKVVGVGTLVDFPAEGLMANPQQLAGDHQTATDGYYVIPAGSSRRFVLNGIMRNGNGQFDLKSVRITGLRYGLSGDQLTDHVITLGLESLVISVPL